MARLSMLLRYAGRHSLYFARDGKLPQLNPIVSRSHDAAGKRTRRIYEPSWLYRLRGRLFRHAGRHWCPSRGDSGVGMPDSWLYGPDGNRACSYCGSMHPDDFMAVCVKVLTDERYSVDGTDKSYKVYVRQPGVINAGHGAIKFYMHHAPVTPTKSEQERFSTALRLSASRFERRMAKATAA